MLLNVCIYYKTVLNVQCSNLMFQLICDKYFPIMAWQREERSGTPACRTADCSISRQFKPCVLGEADHLKFSLPLQTQQLQRLSCCAYYYLFNFLLLLLFFYFFFFIFTLTLYTGISFLQLAVEVWHGTFCGFQRFEMSA